MGSAITLRQRDPGVGGESAFMPSTLVVSMDQRGMEENILMTEGGREALTYFRNSPQFPLEDLPSPTLSPRAGSRRPCPSPSGRY